MKNILMLMKKNLKLLARSKASALIVILGPLLIIFLAGIAFDNSKTYSISIGTFSEAYNDLSKGFIQNLKDNQFSVVEYESQESCVESIKEGSIHSCIIFSPDFKLGENMNNEIVFYIDYSKINLVYMVLDTMTETVNEKSEEMSLSLTTVVLDTIASTKKEITEKKTTIVTLTTKNDETGKKVSSAYDRLDTLDLSNTISTASVTELATKKNSVTSQMDEVEGIAEDAVDEASSLIDDIKDEIESSSLTAEEKSAIMSMLNDSEDDIVDIEESLDSAKNLSEDKIAALNSAISNVSSDISTAKEKLDQAESAKSESLTELDSAKGFIEEALQNIAVLQNSMNAIEDNINSITVTEASNIVNPVETTIKPVVAEKTHLNYIFPVLIVLVLMFTGILLSTTLIMLEKKTTAYFRNFISPTKDITFISATFLTCLLVLLVQVAVILGISAVFFGSHIFYTLPKTIPILIFCMALFTLAGMLVGYLFNSEETATLGAISISSAFLLLSDVILPLESMSRHLFDIAQYNPFVLGSSLLRKIIIHDVSFSSVESGLVSLFLYCIGFFVLVLIVQSISKKHYLSKYLKRIAAKPEHPKNKKENK